MGKRKEKKNIDLSLIPHIKIQSNYFIDLNVKHRTIKTFRRKHREKNFVNEG